ncbi:MAG TPA: hydrogenase maturation nickel metallochaperone HypA [Candidatus Limnocylindrales bacterium]|nr:hydrogenase maturation nickel metallochaperone HypA [Candidatus Limnocylindrales bacterium]
MHEMGLAKAILTVALNAAEGQKVQRICLQIGKLQMVAPDSLEFSFQLVAEGTTAAKAVLEIVEVPPCLRCKQCGAQSEFNHPPFTCTRCGVSDMEIVSGNQVLVDAVELENGVTIKCR